MGDRKFFLTEQGNARNNKANAAILGRMPTVLKKTRRVYPPINGNVVMGRATSTISASTNALTGGQAFTYKRFLTLDASVFPATWQEESEDSDGVNRSPWGYNTDSIVVLALINGEWNLIDVWEACP